MINISQLNLILPEIIFLGIIIIVQILKILNSINNKEIIILNLCGSIAVIYFLIFKYQKEAVSYNVSAELIQIKCIIWIALFIFFVTYIIYYVICNQKIHSEYTLAANLSIISCSIMISAEDAILLFTALELQSITSYVLIGMHRKTSLNAEANLQFFLLNSFITSLFLLGWALIYAYSGTLQYDLLKVIFIKNNALLVGFILIILSMLFKIGSAPLHIWVLNVYQETSITSLVFLTFIPKIGYLVTLSNLLKITENNSLYEIAKYASMLSMIVGSIGGLKQKFFKRLLAYSTIYHIGYVLIPIITDNQNGWKLSIVYLCIYSITVLGILFGLVIYRKNIDNLEIVNLKGLSNKEKTTSFIVSLLILSLIGIPPLAGFFIKYQIFFCMLQKKEYTLIFIGIVSSLISAYYYLKIIQLIYLKKPIVEIKRNKYSLLSTSISVLCCASILLYSFII